MVNKMELNITERLLALELLQSVSGNYVTLKIVRDLQGELSFSEDDLAKYQMVFDGSNAKWNPSEETNKDIDFGETGHKIIKDALAGLDKSNKLTQNHISLYEKFMEA